MRSNSTPAPPSEKRVPVLVYLAPSIKAAVDQRRTAAGQPRSEWIERAIKAALGRKKA